MKLHPWISASIVAGIAVSAAWLIALKPLALADQKGTNSTRKKIDEKKAPSKESNKPSDPDDDVKPGPYPEDPLASDAEKNYVGSGAYRWLTVALQATAREHERHGARPTVGSRNLAMCVTAMYDAWAAYDPKAVGTRLGGKLRRPSSERTTKNKDKAIGVAVCRVLLDIYPDDAAWIKERVRKEGIDPSDNSTDLSTPQGVGNTAAAALLAFRHHDGANQLGDEVGSNGKPYSDWTYYRPVNPPGSGPILDPDRWQPIPFDNGKGGKIALGFLTPHWYRVKPFALKQSDQFRPGPPPQGGFGADETRGRRVPCLQCQPHGGAESHRGIHA
jgi:hypothetical protein